MPELINPLAGYRDAYNLLEGQAQDGARRQAGNALAGGNYQGAQDALYGRGMLDEGMAVQQRQFGVQDREMGQQAAQAEAAKKAAGERAQKGIAILTGMADLPDDQIDGAYQSVLRPYLVETLDPEMMARVDAAPKTRENVRLLLTAMGAEAKKIDYQFMNLGAGGVGRGNESTGDFTVLREPDPVYQQVGPGENLYAIPRGGQPSPGGGGVSPRSPEVGQYIMGQLQGIPGLKLGSPNPRSEAEIAGLPLSAKDTYHRQGAALDFTAPGQQPEAVIASVRARMGAGYDVIYHPENDSYHVEPGPNWSPPGGGLRGSGPQLVASGAPKPAGRMASPQERAQLGIPGDSPVWIGADGKPDVLGGAGATPKDRVALRKEFEQNADVKAFNDVAASYDIISSIASAPASAANDMSMIFAYMKMLDPGSVVREGEFATAQNSAGLPDQVINAYNKALNGQRLAPAQRQQFVTTAGTIYQSRKSRYDQQVAQFQGYATELGLPDTTIQARIPAGPQRGVGGRPREASEAAMTAQQRGKTDGFTLPDGSVVKLDTSKPRGSAANPFIAKDAATLKALERARPGSYVITADGQYGRLN